MGNQISLDHLDVALQNIAAKIEHQHHKRMNKIRNMVLEEEKKEENARKD